MDHLELLKGVEPKKKLTPIERVLATTSGSITQALEAYLGEPIKIRTIAQEVKEAGEMAGLLGVERSEATNFREVEIMDSRGRVLIRAKSWTPLMRLEPEFKEDLMKADIPIGKLLSKHKIEARRELLDVGLHEGKLRRTYNIIRNGKVLMRIEETFES